MAWSIRHAILPSEPSLSIQVRARLAVFFRGFGVAHFQKRPGRLPRIKPRRCLPQLGAYALQARGVNLRADVQDAQRQHPLGVTRGRSGWR